MDVKVLCIVGESKSGKTTLIENIVPILKDRGLKVLVLKHAKEFEIDKKGKNSWRIFKSGADVVITSKEKTAFIGRLSDNLDEILKIFGKGYDLILTEGFGESKFEKIVVLKDCERFKYRNVIAVVSDFDVDFEPRFGKKDYEKISDFIIEWLRSSSP